MDSTTSTHCSSPYAPAQRKEWQGSITLDLRTYIIAKLANARMSPSLLYPRHQPNPCIINWAKNVERHDFEEANNKEDYYRVLAEKIYKLQTALLPANVDENGSYNKMQHVGPDTEGLSSTYPNPPGEAELIDSIAALQLDADTDPVVDAGSGGDGENDLSQFQQNAVPSLQKREWHESVPPDLRTYLVSKFVKDCCSSIRIPLPLLQQDVANYAKKVEEHLFLAANDREEYYKMLANKIYEIQTKLKAKKMQWIAAQLSQLRVAGGPDGNAEVASSPPEPYSQLKEWQKLISAELRAYIISEMAKMVFPIRNMQNEFSHYLHKTIGDGIKLEEKAIFEAASDELEYYNMLAGNVYQLQMAQK